MEFKYLKPGTLCIIIDELDERINEMQKTIDAQTAQIYGLLDRVGPDPDSMIASFCMETLKKYWADVNSDPLVTLLLDEIVKRTSEEEVIIFVMGAQKTNHKQAAQIVKHHDK